MQKPGQKKEDDLASQVLERLKHPPVEVVNPKGSDSNTKKYLLISFILIILAVGGFAAWKFFLKDEQTTSWPVQQAENQNNSADDKSPLAGLTQKYSSDKLMVDIKYPAGWKVDESSGEITIYSPTEDIESVEGESLPAEFRVLIKQGAGETDSEYLGRGFAVKASKPIKYIDPAFNQRKKSLITDFGLDASTSFSYFVVQGNFKLKKDETLGSDFASEADEILVSGGFYSKDSKDKTKLVSLDPKTYESNELYLTAIEIIKTLKLR